MTIETGCLWELNCHSQEAGADGSSITAQYMWLTVHALYMYEM